jgi:hypothetical protein
MAETVAEPQTTDAAPPATDAPAPEETGTESGGGVADALARLKADAESEAGPEEPEADGWDEDPRDEEEVAMEEGDPEEEDEEDASAAEDDEAEDEAEEEDETPDGEPFTLQLPGRREGDPEEEIQLDGLTKGQRDAFLRLKKGYLRREHLNAEMAKVEESRSELQQVEDGLRADPAGFIRQHVHNPQIRHEVALDYLVDLLDSDNEDSTEAYNSFIETLQDLESDPVRRENHRLKRDRARPEARTDRTETGPSDTDPEVEKVVSTVQSFVPEGTDEAVAAEFMEDTLRGIHRYVVQNELDALSSEQLDEITARYRRAYGFSPPQEGGKGKPDADTNPASASKGTRSRGEPRDTGKRLAKASARRREAATTPAGVGTGPLQSPKLPKNAGVKEAIAQLRQNIRS